MCIYSVWRFAQNSWDRSPWNKHHYFRFYKLGLGKVINRLILSCTPLTTVPSRLFCFNQKSRVEEILGLSIKCFVINREIGLEGVEKNKGWAQAIRKPHSPHCAQMPHPRDNSRLSFSWKSLKLLVHAWITQESPILNRRNSKENSVSDQSV